MTHINHTSDLHLTRALVFAKQTLTVISLLDNDQLALFGQEMKAYCRFGDPADFTAGNLFADMAKAYLENDA